MAKINLKPVGDFAVFCGKIVGYSVVLALPRIVSGYVLNEIDKRPVGYSDAVKSIMDSSMLSSYKREAISEIKHDKGDEYYKTVIYIVNSTMLSSDKVKMIHDLSDES